MTVNQSVTKNVEDVEDVEGEMYALWNFFLLLIQHLFLAQLLFTQNDLHIFAINITHKNSRL